MQKTASEVHLACPLCGAVQSQIFLHQAPPAQPAHQVQQKQQMQPVGPVGSVKSLGRSYLQCAHCQLIYVPPDQRLSTEEERGRYTLHENCLEDEAYLRFLRRLWLPLHQVLQPQEHLLGLDFGCGPVEAFREIARQEKMDCSILPYDPLFFPSTEVLKKGTFDFILASEVFEHLHSPGVVISQLFSCLKPGGWLAVMTGELEDWTQFSTWHYPHDPTHVCFYPRSTREFIAQHFGVRLLSPTLTVSLYQRPPELSHTPGIKGPADEGAFTTAPFKGGVKEFGWERMVRGV